VNRWRSAAPFAAPFAAGGARRCLLRSPAGFLLSTTGLLFPAQDLPPEDSRYREQALGFFNEAPVFLRLVADPVDIPGAQWQNLRTLMQQVDAATLQMLGFAEQIAHWQFEHRFCGHCATALQQVPYQRCMRCPACGQEHYPRISPSMIVLVTRGDDILLARSPRFVAGMYSTLAGFAEPGESIEHCVVREVREEVALEISNLRYQGSQSWPFPHSLMLGFHADWAGGEIVRQQDEIEDAQWFSIHQLPKLPMPQSIARQLIESYIKQRIDSAD